MSEPGQALLRAYRDTCYRVLTRPQPIDLRIGAPSPALDALLERRGAMTAAFLTACNPRSEPLSAPENAARQQALRATLAELGFEPVAGAGIADAGDWPAEDSLLIPGIDLATSHELAQRFGQYAYLWLVARQPVQLALSPLWNHARRS